MMVGRIFAKLRTLWITRKALISALLALHILGLPLSSVAADESVEGQPSPVRSERPEKDTTGQGDYARFLGRLSIENPTPDVAGLFAVFRVTQRLCRSLYREERTLEDAAPKGFTITRADSYFLFPTENWDRTWYAITKTKDPDQDLREGNPVWEIKFDKEGRLKTCRVSLGDPVSPDQSASIKSETEREHMVRYFYLGLPQIFYGIIVTPQNLGTYKLSQSDLIELVMPCGSDWCKIETIYDLSHGRRYFSITLNLAAPLRRE